MAAAARFGANEIVSYLICHPKIDINKKVAIFGMGCTCDITSEFPLFFSVLYQNDYVNLKLLLDNPSFDINSLYAGLDHLSDLWCSNEWKLDPKTKAVLLASKYRDSFREIIDNSDKEESWEVPYFCGYRIDLDDFLDSFSY